MYLALTQGTAEWLLPKVGVIDALNAALPQLCAANSELNECDFLEGPLRISADESRQLIVLWHVDYILGTGDEPWGFIKIGGDLSVTDVPAISREVLERAIYVVNQRLQCLMIDGAYFYRRYPNDAHTLLAGRGSNARHFSIGYFESHAQGASTDIRTVICVGPHESFPTLTTAVEKEARKIPQFTLIADKVVTRPRRLPAANEYLFSLRQALTGFLEIHVATSGFENVEIMAGAKAISEADASMTIGMTYDDWLSHLSPLSDTQRRILTSDSLDRHPLRVVGPAGSGKTLLMQLLAIRRLYAAEDEGIPKNLLYIVHSDAMRAKVIQKLQMLTEGRIEADGKIGASSVRVSTLAEYCRNELQLGISSVIDPDATDAKTFQLDQVLSALGMMKSRMEEAVEKSSLLREIFAHPEFEEIFAKLVLAEISIAIKGHGLEQDKKRYVESERNLSRLHGVLDRNEREFIFATFQEYHRVVFESYSVLDPDDIALSLAGRLRTAVWQLRRRTEGYDYVFVDEAQLFNENERRVLPLLTKGSTNHVPIALALDEAQAIYGQPGAGLATLGIKDITNENLESVYRSTSDIAKLAFFIIQKSTNLFGPDFPDFTQTDGYRAADQHPLATPPMIEIQAADSQKFSKFVLKRVRELRRKNIRQIVIVCHADKYWSDLEQELSKSDLPFQVLRDRGEKIRPDEPIVVLSRPAQVGGQEFDAALVIGLEMGLVPPNIIDNEALATAIEQQTIREMYLSITRARYAVVFPMSSGATPNSLLQQAKQAKLVR